MSAASNMNEDSKTSMLWHEELPILLSLARQGLKLRKAILAKGIEWKTKQRLSCATRAALTVSVELRDGRKSAHPTVRRGENPKTDSIIDCLREFYEVELSDMSAFLDWMKKNNYNPSPDLYAIDELVESTKMKPSQIVAWFEEMGDKVAKLHGTGTVEKQPEIIVIDDDDDNEEEDSVPELGEEQDAWNGLVAGVGVEIESKVDDEAAFDLMGLESPESLLDLLLLELDLDFGSSEYSSGGIIQTGHSGGQKSSAPGVRLTDGEESELFDYLSSQMGNDNEFQ